MLLFTSSFVWLFGYLFVCLPACLFVTIVGCVCMCVFGRASCGCLRVCVLFILPNRVFVCCLIECLLDCLSSLCVAIAYLCIVRLVCSACLFVLFVCVCLCLCVCLLGVCL